MQLPENKLCEIKISKSDKLTKDEIFNIEHDVNSFVDVIHHPSFNVDSASSPYQFYSSFVIDERAFDAVGNYLMNSLKLGECYNVDLKLSNVDGIQKIP